MQRLGPTRLSRTLSLIPGLFALLTGYSCAQSNPSGPCADGLTACGIECDDLQTDPHHCGACDRACATGTACEAGACAGGCVEGFLDCGKGCIDPQTDPHNCGACGLACPAGTPCDKGVCGVACPDGYTACDGACVDLMSSLQHCGSCDADCQVGSFCVEGTCQPCQVGFTRCGTQCVDLQHDPLHCGSCEIACPERFVCADGQCDDDCGTNQALCNGVCVNLQASNENCGACGAPCQPGFQCSSGLCQSRCAPTQLFCAGRCVDAQTNALHCGACFQSCPVDYVCEAGACRNPCPAGQDPCSGECVDLMTDPANCGGCSQACAPELLCAAGACACAGESVCGVCSPTPLASRVPQIVTGNTTIGVDTYNPACVTMDSNEVGYSFTAPTNGSYSFSLAGSAYDTVLAVLSDACASLACNDNSSGSTSQVMVNFRSGQTVSVVVDGANGRTGAFSLSITGGIPCTTTDLGSTVPQTIRGTTAGLLDVLTPSCGAPGGRDRKYVFTAPADGNYTFDTRGSSTNTILHVHDGSCSGPELACNDDTEGPQSEVTVTLTAGQVVVVAVDGAGVAATGPYMLNIR